jgi:hypothetical protein
MARTEGSTELASDEECATVVPVIAAGAVLACAEDAEDAAAVAEEDAVTAVGPAVVGVTGATAPPGAIWVGVPTAPGCVALGIGDADGGALTRASSAPRSVGTLPF